MHHELGAHKMAWSILVLWCGPSSYESGDTIVLPISRIHKLLVEWRGSLHAELIYWSSTVSLVPPSEATDVLVASVLSHEASNSGALVGSCLIKSCFAHFCKRWCLRVRLLRVILTLFV